MSSSLIPAQRRTVLLELLASQELVTLRAAAEALGVSVMTVRRDVAALVTDGLAEAVSGGVRRLVGARPPVERAGRAALEREQKVAIADRVAALVEPGMTVYLDAGTTCQMIAGRLAVAGPMTVVTNDLVTALDLTAHPTIRVLHTGGRVDHDSQSCAGPAAVDSLRGLSLDLCVLSTGSWDLRRGVTTTDEDKVVLKRAAVDAASRAVLAAGSSKFGIRSPFVVVGLEGLDLVVTDRGLPAAAAAALRDAGIGLELAGLE